MTGFAIKKQLPPDIQGSLECEMSLLATILFNGGRIAACESLGPQHFVEPLFARIFEAIEKQASEGLIQPLILAHQFTNDEGFQSFGKTSSEFFANLAANANIPVAVPHLARQIRNDYALRKLAGLATEVYQQAVKPQSGDTAEIICASIIDEVSRVLSDVGAGHTSQHEFMLHDAFDEIISSLEHIPIRWNHLIDKNMRQNKGLERAI